MPEILYTKIIHAQFVLGAQPPITSNLDLSGISFPADAVRIRSCVYKNTGGAEAKLGNVILPFVGAICNPICAFADGISLENGHIIKFPSPRTLSNETITFVNVPATDATARAGTLSLCLEFIKYK